MDDTALVVETEEQARATLIVLEEVAWMYGLRLNRSKFEMLSLGEWRPVPFDTPEGYVKRATHGTYPRCQIYANGDLGKEVGQRIGNAHYTWQSLGIFWKKAACSVKWKVRAYDAVIRSKLVYRLHSGAHDRTLVEIGRVPNAWPTTNPEIAPSVRRKSKHERPGSTRSGAGIGPGGASAGAPLL